MTRLGQVAGADHSARRRPGGSMPRARSTESGHLGYRRFPSAATLSDGFTDMPPRLKINDSGELPEGLQGGAVGWLIVRRKGYRMKIVIAGGHGKIALRLTRLLAERGDTVVGVVRNPRHVDDIRRAGGDAVVLDLEHAT